MIHTVGPIWRGGIHGERELLVSVYRSSLELVLANQCETVAFPLISAGVYGVPKNQALKVAVDTIGDFLLAHDMTVYLVIFDRDTYTIGGKLFAKIRSDVHYKPSKPTAMAFVGALESPLEADQEMLEKAYFAFSHASKFDIIEEYFIAHRN